jgi:adenosylcobinamide-phosphate synthase
MSLGFNLALVTAALLVEAVIGYPNFLYRWFRHPVVWMGALINWLDSRLNRASMSEAKRRLNGTLALITLLLAALLPAAAIQVGLVHVLPKADAVILLAFAASTFIAQVSLYDHVRDVADAFEGQRLDAAREAVAEIVGRDTTMLDEAGVARAAIESLAENFSDGVVAPSLWCALLGLPGLVGYKAVNTTDSMIGHKNERHGSFGFASAKLDDFLNLPASRLSVLWIALAALFHRGASARNALKIARRDARHHRSPNAGWPEAAFAGALGFKLSGPRSYEGAITEQPWIGDGSSELTASDIRRALALYRTSCALQIAFYACLTLIVLA